MVYRLRTQWWRNGSPDARNVGPSNRRVRTAVRAGISGRWRKSRSVVPNEETDQATIGTTSFKTNGTGRFIVVKVLRDLTSNGDVAQKRDDGYHHQHARYLGSGRLRREGLQKEGCQTAILHPCQINGLEADCQTCGRYGCRILTECSQGNGPLYVVTI